MKNRIIFIWQVLQFISKLTVEFVSSKAIMTEIKFMDNNKAVSFFSSIIVLLVCDSRVFEK